MIVLGVFAGGGQDLFFGATRLELAPGHQRITFQYFRHRSHARICGRNLAHGGSSGVAGQTLGRHHRCVEWHLCPLAQLARRRGSLLKRRDVLRSLVGVAGVGIALPSEAQALSPAAVEELMRAHGLEPRPGEGAMVLAFLLSVRPRTLPDPRIEPAIRMDPEVDP